MPLSIIKKLTPIFLTLVLLVVYFTDLNVYSPPRWEKTSSLEQVLDQHLKVSFSSLDALPSSTHGQKAKILYYYVAGPPTSGYPANFNGPSKGLFGLLSDVIEHSAIQEAFQGASVSSCSNLPVTGTISAPGHSEGQLGLSFYPGRKTVPSHFPVDAGAVFEKRIQMDSPSGHLVSIEMNCPSNGVHSGYMVIEKNRRIEMYYQFNTNTDEQHLDAYMDYSTALGNSFNEKLALRFVSDNGKRFRIWGVRTTDDATQGSVGVAVEGDHDSKKAQVRVVEDSDATPDTATALEAGSPACVSLEDGDEDETGCPSVTAPVSTVHGNDFDLPGTDSIPVETIEVLRADAPVYDFDSSDVGSSHDKTITLTNVGAASVSAISVATLSAPFSFSGGSYPGTAGTCATTIAAGASCQLVISFTPTTAGSFSEMVEISYTMNGLSYDTTVDLKGQSVAPSPAQLTISDGPTYDFGTHNTGTTTSHSLTVTNAGAQTATGISGATLPAPFGFSGGSFPGTGGTCGASLAAGGSCSVEVTFSPTAIGTLSDALSISYNDGAAAQTAQRNLTGTGASASLASLTISEADPFDFGSVTVGGVNSHTFTISNSGSGTATSLVESGLALPFNYVGGSYPGTGGDCSSTLVAGGSCTIAIEFSPTASGPHVDTISLSYNDGSSVQTATRNIQGTGVNPALLMISDGPTFDFGPVTGGSSASHSFTVTNNGGSTATSIFDGGTLASPYSYSGGAYPGGGTCTSTVPAGASCTIIVEFAPVITGTYNGVISINYNDGAISQVATRDVTGSSP